MSGVSVQSRNSRDFVVSCPDHPDVTLMIRKAGLFSRTKIVNRECPRCQGEVWTSQSLDGYSVDQSSHSYVSHTTPYASATVLEASAPLDDRTTPGLQTIHEDADSISPSVMEALINSMEAQRRGQETDHSSTRPRVDHGPSSNSPRHDVYAGDGSFDAEGVGTSDVGQQITDMVHSLLEGHHRKGANHIVNQLETLCAWAFDEDVRALIVDAGGIYIIINLLQRCQQRVGENSSENFVPRQATDDNTSAPQPNVDHTTFVATTIATHSLDDATTIVTHENLDDLDDNMTQAPWVLDAEAASPAPSHSHRSTATPVTQDSYYLSSSNRSPTRVSGAESVASSQPSFVASRPPTLNAIDRAFGYPGPASGVTASQTPTMDPLAGVAASPSPLPPQSRLDDIRANKRQLEQTIKQTMSDLSDQQREHRNMQSTFSPAPPTMNDIDRAFGHMMASPIGSNSSHAGGSYQSQFTTPYSAASPQLRVPDGPSSDASAAEMYTMPSSYRTNSASSGSVSTLRRDASTANYIPAEAMDSAMSMAAINALDTQVIEKEVRWGVAILSTLAKDAPLDRLDILQSAGGIETVLGAMWRYEGDEMVQESGCACLYYLSSSANSHFKTLIISFGGISTFLRAMGLFPTTAALQTCCCRFVATIVSHDPVALESVVTLRGIELILLAMKMHRVEEDIQLAACEALDIMMRAGQQQVYRDVVDNGGMDAVLTAMWQFECNGMLQQFAISSLGQMCELDDGNKRLALEAGAIETILAAMQRHSQNVNVQRAGVTALSMITNNYGEAIRRLHQENASAILRPAAPHDPESAKLLLRNMRLQRYRSRVF